MLISARILLIALLALVLSTCSGDQKDVPPNIIVFLVDDMGWQDTSVPFWTEETDFNRRYRTPNMEKMAADGMKFTQAYAHSVCSPTRVSLMSGMNPARHRVTNWTLRYDVSQDGLHEKLAFPQWNMNGLQPTDTVPHAVYATPLPVILRKAGYFTIHCGKAHFGAIGTPGADPLNLGFDVNIAGHAAGAPGSYQGLSNFGNDENGLPSGVWSVPGLEKYHGQDINLTEALTIEALNAVDSARRTNQPFFLYMAHYAVHSPIEADQRFYENYIDADLPEVEARYASMVEGMDRSLGDILSYLEDYKLKENTVVLFMSDNGGLSAVIRGGIPHTHNKPLNSGKGSAYEGGIREPMMISWSGTVQPGAVCNDYLIIEDFFPTIVELAGIDDCRLVQRIDGISFYPLLMQQPVGPSERPLFWHYPNNWGPQGPGIGATSTIRQGSWKLIYYYVDQHFELFNIDDDIGEINDRVEEEKVRVKKMANALGTYLRSVDALRPMDKATGKPIPWPDEVIIELPSKRVTETTFNNAQINAGFLPPG